MVLNRFKNYYRTIMIIFIEPLIVNVYLDLAYRRKQIHEIVHLYRNHHYSSI